MTDQLYRVVDAANQGWHPAGTTEGGWVLSADYGFQRGLPDYPGYDELAAARGPLRPVLPITEDDKAELRQLFTAASRKTITTLAAALETVFDRLRDDHSALDMLDRGGAFEGARTHLLAGREGSWESASLIGVVLFGNELNLAKETRDRRSVEARRAAGPGRRVDVRARDLMADMIYRWVTDPARFTEVAETLASVVSSYADERAGADGWRQIADQWLQPGGLAQETFSVCYRLLYSLSAHFDTSLS